MGTINKLQVRKEKKAVLNNSRTRFTKAAAHEQYTVANRAVKKCVKTDKVYFIDRNLHNTIWRCHANESSHCCCTIAAFPIHNENNDTLRHRRQLINVF